MTMATATAMTIIIINKFCRVLLLPKMSRFVSSNVRLNSAYLVFSLLLPPLHLDWNLYIYILTIFFFVYSYIEYRNVCALITAATALFVCVYPTMRPNSRSLCALFYIDHSSFPLSVYLFLPVSFGCFFALTTNIEFGVCTSRFWSF